jgi:hypothetical protein
MTGQWHALRVPDTLTVDFDLYAAGAKVIPAYLQWLGKQRLRLPGAPTHFVSVASSLADWFETVGGTRERIVDAIEELFWLTAEDEVAITERFYDLVAVAVRDRRANDGRRVTDGTRHGSASLTVSPEVIIRGLDDSAAASILDPLLLEAALSAEGAILKVLPSQKDRRRWRMDRGRWREELRLREGN